MLQFGQSTVRLAEIARQAGQADAAEDLLDKTAKRLQDRKKSRAIVLGNLALVRVRQRKLEPGIAVLHDAITELERTRGGGGMNLVFSVARELQSWRQEPTVLDVQDRLMMLMAGTP